MTIKQHGGIFGRNPTFNNVTVDGTLTVDQIVEKTGAAGITLDGVTLKDGNVVLTNGKGIDFSATAGTGTSELFDDYEEGTWTPTFSDSTTGGTTTGTGVYTKVGNKVTVHAVINDIDTTGLTASNKAYILGFPFAATSLQSVIGNVWFSGGVTTSGACFVYLQTGLSYARFFESPYAGTGDILSVSAFTDDAADLNINITYIAS